MSDHAIETDHDAVTRFRNCEKTAGAIGLQLFVRVNGFELQDKDGKGLVFCQSVNTLEDFMDGYMEGKKAK